MALSIDLSLLISINIEAGAVRQGVEEGELRACCDDDWGHGRTKHIEQTLR